METKFAVVSRDSPYLSHHGTKGQQWGVRRGPPYPLKNGIRSKIKTITKKAEARASARKERRETKQAEKAAQKDRSSKPTIKDKLAKMSDAELQEKKTRAILEKEYLKAVGELNVMTKGESWLSKAEKAVKTGNSIMNTVADSLTGWEKLSKAWKSAMGENSESGSKTWDQLTNDELKSWASRFQNLNSIKKATSASGPSSYKEQANSKKPDNTLPDPPKDKNKKK